MERIWGPTEHIHYHGSEEPPLPIERSSYNRSRLIKDTSDTISEEHQELTYMTTFLLTEGFQLSYGNPTYIGKVSATRYVHE